MDKLKIYDYQGSQIQFDEIDGKIMANATLMGLAFSKKPDDIFKTKSWAEYEAALIETKKMRFEDIRTVKNGENGGSWIHQELVIEFARRLNPKFSIWCNDRIAELLRTNKTEIKPVSIEEMMIQQLKGMIEAKKDISDLKEEVREIKAHNSTHPQNYFTISGFSILKKINVDLATAAKVGKAATKMCKDIGCSMGSVPDSRYAKVNTYPLDVLEAVFNNLGIYPIKRSA